jgi:Flp pilus assembly protein TadG
MRYQGHLKSEKGAVLVEMAIALPLLLLLVWCMIDFARAYYTSNSLSTAVREGARFAAVQSDPGGSAAAIKAKVKQSFNAFGGDTILDAAIIVLDSSRIPVGNERGKVTVQVKNYDWFSSTPVKIFTGGKITMTRQATFRWEREPTT